MKRVDPPVLPKWSLFCELASSYVFSLRINTVNAKIFSTWLS
jgi:hypothetical protein